MITYLVIFILKLLENTLSTLRLILVAHGKKVIGAILQGIVTLVWIISASIVIIDINKDIYKIIFFCLGSIIGSLLGSIIEEKIALGDISITCISNNNIDICNKLNKYKVYNNNNILTIYSKRKEINNIKKIIKSIDNKAIITIEKIKYIV